MFKRLMACLLVVSALVTTAPKAAFAGDQDFHLFNRTGVDIYKLYVAPHSTDDWAEDDDLLDGAVLQNGADVMVVFSPKTQSQLWDLRVEDSDGGSLEWSGIDLIRAEEIILENNGKARIK